MVSCKTLQVHQSQKPSDKLVHGSYDDTYKLSWQVVNDDDFMTIHLATHHQTTQLRMLRRGLTIGFNTDLKRKPEFGINYPIAQKNNNFFLTRKQPVEGRKRKEPKPRKNLRLERMAKRISPKMALIRNKEVDSLLLNSLPEGFHIDLTVDGDTLNLEYKIPLSWIFGDGNTMLPMAVGIESGSFDIPVSMMNRPTDMPRNKQLPELVDPVKIWFKVLPVKNS